VAGVDIFEIESATPCGGTICNAGSPFSNLGGLSIGSGTQKYLITDNTGTFSFIFTGSAGDNGSCQIDGGAASFFSGCTGSNSNGTGFSNGHDLTGGDGTFPPTVLTFTAIPGAFSSCSSLNPCNFTFGFVSMQGTGVTAVPEPSTFLLLGF